MRIAICAALFAVLGGCGVVSEDAKAGDAGLDAGPDAPAITLEAACATRADAVCRDFAACAGISLRRWYADEAACRAGERHVCVRDATLPGLVDAIPKVLACADLVAKVECGARGAWITLFCGPRQGRGTLEDGAGCWYDDQCKGGLCTGGDVDLSSPLEPPSCGRCARISAPGDPCAPGSGWPTNCERLSTTFKGSDLVCDPATKTCVPRAAEGAPCSFTDACASEARCVGGVCVAPTARLGDACGPAVGGCAEGFCWEGRCAPSSEAYGTVWPKLVGVGEECDGDTRWCLAGAWCSPAAFPSICAAPLPLGAPCRGTDSCGHLAACMRVGDGSGKTCVDSRPLCPRPPA